MFANVAYKLFGSSNERVLKTLRKPIALINAFEPKLEKLSDAELKGQTQKLQLRIANGETLQDLLPEAFASVREAAKRAIQHRHFDVQLMGGIALHNGKIAEMRTGEGKTLVATLPVYLNALSDKGVHVVTVNDYLAQRDADWMRPVYEALGMSVGYILGDMKDEDRRNAYAADITYGTNNEFGFDYLRDNMKFRDSELVQRPFNFAIIDEVDSILIDEARTPLIISGQVEDSAEMYHSVDKIIPELEDPDFEVDEKYKNATLTDRGNEHVEEILLKHNLLTSGNLYDAENIGLVHHVNQALRAHKLFTRDVDYIVKDNQVIIIDEFTGRMMEGRRFSEGLHQALEAKEGAKVQNESQTLASITFQNYFRLYPKLAGMTGTAMTEAAEFEEIYELRVVDMPTNKEQVRTDHHDEIYRTAEEKFEAILKQIQRCHDREQPVLVGTTSIEKSEMLSTLLKKEKIKHNVLNARYHEQEAHIVAQAGRPNAITIATNMAGRGTDIKLGGNLEMRIEAEVAEDLDDKKRTALIKKIKSELSKDSKKVKEAGGLFIICTERHESRRIDNQLRGRSARQGDPGETKFYLSLEDDLMRIFGSEKMDVFLQKMGLKRGQPIIHPWINKAIERAQKKVEAQHFEVRKNLLKFDNVMNDQRKVVYEQRREIMSSDNLADVVKDMRHEVIEDMVGKFIPSNSYSEQWDIKNLNVESHRLLNIDPPLEEWANEEGVADQEILERLLDSSDKHMAEKAVKFTPELMRSVEKSVLLQILDQTWKEHLLNLDHLRQGIQLRAFGQRDPLNEYKTEAFEMFSSMLTRLRENITMALSLIEIKSAPPPPPSLPTMQQNRGEGVDAQEIDKNNPETWGKVPRNSACPCGSGMKYKHCHGKAN